MKRKAILIVLAMVAAPVFAQDIDNRNHGEVGAFFDYFRLHNSNPTVNNYGFGGRLGFNVHPNVQLEAEGAYDFRQTTTATISGGLTPGAVTSTYAADFRVTHGLFGLKVHSTGPVRVFAVAKGGFINFSVSTTGAPATFTNTLNGIADGDTHPVFYSGGGVELFAGWFGIRGEVGDEMYFSNGVNHNLRISVGPQIRF